MSDRGTPGHLHHKLFKGHPIKNRGVEAILGATLFIVGCILIWDAFDNRGKSLPWPLSAILPW